jgi:hypothetical protein
MSRIEWGHVLNQAAAIVRSYDTSVTLRQLFYRLVSAQLLPNTEQAYKGLSRATAQARRDGAFPDLIDRGRQIHRSLAFDGPGEAVGSLVDWYRLDRTRGQAVSLYLGVEKAGMVVQLEAWFSDLGIPVLALGGYSSQTYVDEVAADVSSSGRAGILLYAGDFDPSGEDIDRDFIDRVAVWHTVQRVALSVDQVREHELPINPGKVTDSRAPAFIQRHGALMQVELDALPPETLRQLYTDAIAEHWDTSAYEDVLTEEEAGREQLLNLARHLGGES